MNTRQRGVPPREANLPPPAKHRSAMTEQKTPRNPPWLKRLGNRIRRVRRLRGLTQTDLAEPNLTKSFISLLESGRTYPSVATLINIANRLQTSLALLLLDTAELPRETTLTLLTLARTVAETAPADAERLLAASEVLSANADDLRADLILTRGDIALAQGKARDAERLFEEALTWARRHKLPAYEPRAQARLAMLALKRGDETTGRQTLEAAIEAFRTTRTLRSVEGCEAMLAYGELLNSSGRTARAVRIFEEVAQVARRHDLPLILGRALVGAAAVRVATGQIAEAREALQEARTALEAGAEGAEGAQILRTAGVLLFRTGLAAEALGLLHQALRLQEASGETRGRAAILNDLARVLLHQGKAAEAQAQAKAALELAESQHDQAQRAEILVTTARIARHQRRFKQAADLFKEALEIFRKAKMTAEVGETARELGMLLKERGEHAEAADYLAMAISTERPDRAPRQ